MDSSATLWSCRTIVCHNWELWLSIKNPRCLAAQRPYCRHKTASSFFSFFDLQNLVLPARLTKWNISPCWPDVFTLDFHSGLPSSSHPPTRRTFPPWHYTWSNSTVHQASYHANQNFSTPKFEVTVLHNALVKFYFPSARFKLALEITNNVWPSNSTYTS